MDTTRTPQPLEPHEVAGMCEAVADSGTITGVRTAALIAFLYRSGLRISEALAVTPNDLDERPGGVYVHVRAGKGGRSAYCRLLADSSGFIALWMGMRAGLGVGKTDPLFCTVSRGDKQAPGSALDRSDQLKALKRAGRLAGVSKRVTCHNMRHSHATLLYAVLKQPTAVVQDQLRHVRPQTTDLYLKRLGCSHTLDQLDGLAA